MVKVPPPEKAIAAEGRLVTDSNLSSGKVSTWLTKSSVFCQAFVFKTFWAPTNEIRIVGKANTKKDIFAEYLNHLGWIKFNQSFFPLKWCLHLKKQYLCAQQAGGNERQSRPTHRLHWILKNRRDIWSVVQLRFFCFLNWIIRQINRRWKHKF